MTAAAAEGPGFVIAEPSVKVKMSLIFLFLSIFSMLDATNCFRCFLVSFLLLSVVVRL